MLNTAIASHIINSFSGLNISTRRKTSWLKMSKLNFFFIVLITNTFFVVVFFLIFYFFQMYLCPTLMRIHKCEKPLKLITCITITKMYCDVYFSLFLHTFNWTLSRYNFLLAFINQIPRLSRIYLNLHDMTIDFYQAFKSQRR